MRILVLEAHNLVLNGWAVARTFAIHPAPILGSLMQVGFYHGVGCCCGMGQVTRHLLPFYMDLNHNHLVEAANRTTIAGFLLQGYT